MYQITVNLIPGLPKIPYEKGVGKPEGVVMHSTAVYEDTVDSERAYEAGHWKSAFVHTFTDHTRILQVADFNYIAYGAGPTANKKFIHHELCQTHDPAKFAKAFDMWCWVAAKNLYDYGLKPIDGVTVLSHAQVSQRWHETDHDDPIGYLKEHGKTWQDVVDTITKHYNSFLPTSRAGAPTPPPKPSQPAIPPTVAIGSKDTETVKKLQTLLHIPADGIFGPQTKAALINFQKQHGLTPDGICGPQTWSVLLSTVH